MTLWLLLCAAVILGIVALGLDGGRVMDERRAAQSAADAAALAAAKHLYSGYWQHQGKDPNGAAKSAALQLAAANRFDNDGTSNTVAVNIPPKEGAFAGKSGYVEVVVRRSLDASFGRIFTKSDLPVRARAVAQGLPMNLGVILLRANGADVFRNEALAFTLLGTPLIVNSSDLNAYRQSTFSTVIASRLDVTGGFSNPAGALMLTKVRTGVRPTPDPLALLPIPNSNAAVVRSNTPLTINSLLPTTLQPGVYRGGIHVKGLLTIVVMMPGLYIMEGGGFVVEGAATVTGLEVVVYNTTSSTYASGPIRVDSLGKVVMAAPLSGTYQGINFFQQRALTQPLSIRGAGLTTITGVVYAAKAPVHLTGALAVGLNLLGGAFVCDSMLVEGTGGVTLDLKLNPPRIPDVRLVE